MALTLPPTDPGLLAWGNNFKAGITPSPTTLGLTAAQVTAYGTVLTSYSTALGACDPNIRSKAAVATKNTAKAALKLASEQTVALIMGTPTVTDAEKIALGIPPRATPQPIPAPITAPVIGIVSVSGRTIKIGLKAASGDKRRGKPAGVIGASVFSYVGTTPPNDVAGWKFEGNTGKTVVDVVFPNTAPAGSQVLLYRVLVQRPQAVGPGLPAGQCLPGRRQRDGGVRQRNCRLPI